MYMAHMYLWPRSSTNQAAGCVVLLKGEGSYVPAVDAVKAALSMKLHARGWLCGPYPNLTWVSNKRFHLLTRNSKASRSACRCTEAPLGLCVQCRFLPRRQRIRFAVLASSKRSRYAGEQRPTLGSRGQSTRADFICRQLQRDLPRDVSLLHARRNAEVPHVQWQRTGNRGRADGEPHH